MLFRSYPKASSNNIGISHGVSWDNNCDFKSGKQFWDINERFIKSARLIETFVTVDTNTASWFQTVDYNTAIKMKYIPNYVDTQRFSPRNGYDEPRKKTIILYPRRLYYPRGYYMLLDVIDDILGKYPHVEFHFAGGGIEKDTINIREKQQKWKGRVQWQEFSMNDMPNVYKNSDISVIPSLFSEGTSLSCLEAMASGNAVITTRVGGLPDLVISGYNGIIIDPSPNDLKQAIMSLLDNPENTQHLKKGAVEVSKAFSKTKWEKSWSGIIRSKLDLKNLPKNTKSRLAVIYVEDIITLDSFSLRKLIAEHLWEGELIYIKIKNHSDRLPGSYGRLQYLEWNETLTAKADYIVADKKCLKDIKEKISPSEIF